MKRLLWFSPSTSLGYTEMLMRRRIDKAAAREIHDARDLGASVVEWVVISALLVGIAIAVGTVLMNSLEDKAKSIDLDTSTP